MSIRTHAAQRPSSSRIVCLRAALRSAKKVAYGYIGVLELKGRQIDPLLLATLRQSQDNDRNVYDPSTRCKSFQ